MRWSEALEKIADYAAESLEKNDRSFWRYLARSRFFVLAVILAAFALHQSELPDKFATQTLDAIFKIREPRQAKHVYLVLIDQQDYKSPNIFRESSPLRVGMLEEVIVRIASGNPALIAIDVDTSAGQFLDWRVPPVPMPVVWGINPRFQDGEVIALPLLGGRPPDSALKQGLAGLPQDSDGIVRRYFRTVKTKEGAELSLPAAVRMQFPNPPAEKDLRKEYFLNYYGNRYSLPRMTVSQLLRATDKPAPQWREGGPLTGKVVLLGGTYWEARDEHVTPIGVLSGAELMGQSIESELAGDNISGRRRWVMGVAQVISMILVLFVYYRFRLKSAFWVGLGLLPILSLISSYLAFSSFALWLYFLPGLGVLMVQQLYVKAGEFAKAFDRLGMRGATGNTEQRFG
jgi:CHASE2 domain-containing sensor protein